MSQKQNRGGVQFIHLRTRNNGVPQEKGGYTIAIKQRPDGNYSVTICQCNSNQRYNEKLGEKVAGQRLSRGQFFVQNKDELIATLNTLHSKLSTGTVVRLNIEAALGIKEERKAA